MYLSVKVVTRLQNCTKLHFLLAGLWQRIRLAFCALLRVEKTTDGKNFSIHFSACSDSVDSA
jgi:hypothetical protein